MSNRIILITGSHRSGSTWVGRVITSSDGSEYIHEPFHPRSNTEYPSYPFKHMFQFIDQNSEDDQSALTYIDDISKSVSDNTVSIDTNIILKDPMAFFAAEWFYKKYQCDIILCLRHPLAFVASIKNKNWTFDFRNFNKQPGLINSYLKSFQKDIVLAIQNNVDIIQQGILLWNIFSYTTYMYKLKYRNMLLVTNEELSINPFWEFKSIFNYLKLDFTPKVIDYIQSTSNQKVKQRISRNSAQNIYNWQNILNDSEVELIKQGTSNYSSLFYSELSWLKPFKIYNGQLSDYFKGNQLVAHTQEIDIVIDRINDKKLKINFDKGFKDAIQNHKNYLINIKGRAFNKKNHLSYSDIYIQFDSFFVKGICGQFRKDVSDFYHSESLLNCGFEVELPTHVFNEMKLKNFTVYLFQKNYDNYYAQTIVFND